jgi:SAM-dependent methyltransferase
MAASDNQSQVFADGEGDAWFRRNRTALAGRPPHDWIEHFVSQIENRLQIASVCDLGCANGWRLAALADLLNPAAALCGVDASAEAVADGQRRFPRLQLSQGVLSKLPYERSFDLVIVSFVLHWVDRGELVRVLAEIDRIVAWSGYLIVSDFFPDRPSRRKYHHLPDRDVHTYKQDYAGAFENLGLYRRIAQATFSHAGSGNTAGDLTLGPVESGERCACTLLHKTQAGYLEL